MGAVKLSFARTCAGRLRGLWSPDPRVRRLGPLFVVPRKPVTRRRRPRFTRGSRRLRAAAEARPEARGEPPQGRLRTPGENEVKIWLLAKCHDYRQLPGPITVFSGDLTRISLGDVRLWFDVSGPSVLADGDTTVDRPTIVAVHGGPGVDHTNVKAKLAPLAEYAQVVYYDQRGHGRSDHSTSEHWNLRTWADDLRRLCDALSLDKPVVLGTSFGESFLFSFHSRQGSPGRSGPSTSTCTISAMKHPVLTPGACYPRSPARCWC